MDAKEYLSKNNVITAKDPFWFTFTFHNKVNQKLKKPIITEMQYEQMYSVVNSNMIEKINEFTEYLKKNGTRKGVSSINMKYYMDFLRYLHSSQKLFQIRYITI